MDHCVATSARVGKSISTLILQARRATLRSIKFIRWIRQSIRDQVAEAPAMPRLKNLYANLELHPMETVGDKGTILVEATPSAAAGELL